MQNLKCPNCGDNIAQQDINISAALAKCSHCGEVFGFANLLSVTAKPLILIPKGITVRNEGEDLIITRWWFDFSWLCILIICFSFALFGIMMVLNMLPAHPPLEEYEPFSPLILAVIGSLFGFYNLINHTEIRINSSRLEIRHIPFAFTKSKSIDVTQINQLYCIDRSSYQRSGENEVCRFSVWMVSNNGDHQKLITGINYGMQALYIVQEIERYLKIVDKPVIDEVTM